MIHGLNPKNLNPDDANPKESSQIRWEFGRKAWDSRHLDENLGIRVTWIQVLGIRSRYQNFRVFYPNNLGEGLPFSKTGLDAIFKPLPHDYVL